MTIWTKHWRASMASSLTILAKFSHCRMGRLPIEIVVYSSTSETSGRLHATILSKFFLKFHVANCSTLDQMRQQGRFARYVISTRIDGKFKMNFIDRSGTQSSICELKICILCLTHLRYKGYKQGTRRRDKEIYNGFTLQEYFAPYPKNQITTLPLHTDDTAPVNEYGHGFRERSHRYRAENGWRCQRCGIDLSHPPHRKYLHTHHLNAQKDDDRRENHRALCIRCHAEEPMHKHLKNSPDHGEFMKIYALLMEQTGRR